MTTKVYPYSHGGDLYRFMNYEEDPNYLRAHPKIRSTPKLKKAGSVLKKSRSVPKKSVSTGRKTKGVSKKVKAKSSARPKSAAKKTVKKIVLKDQEQQTLASISTQEPTYYGILKNGNNYPGDLDYYN